MARMTPHDRVAEAQRRYDEASERLMGERNLVFYEEWESKRMTCQDIATATGLTRSRIDQIVRRVKREQMSKL